VGGNRGFNPGENLLFFRSFPSLSGPTVHTRSPAAPRSKKAVGVAGCEQNQHALLLVRPFFIGIIDSRQIIL
jgi:hypothetical protein